jgi:hypothetical protein
MAPTEEAAMFVTRRRLAQDEHIKREAGGPAIIEAFRSEQALFKALNPAIQLPGPPLLVADPAEAQIDVIVGVRLVVPNFKRADDALACAIDIARDPTYRERRQAVHSWQRQKVDEWSKKTELGALPAAAEIEAAGRELDDLIAKYNQKAKKAAKKRRTETAILIATIGTAAIGVTASVVPSLFAFAAVGSLAGPQAIQATVFGANGLLQCIKHRVARSEPDAASRVPLVGAMFHQLEHGATWKRRLRAQLPFLK